ncbi:MAG: TetR/AcrR family transcriptional regulator [Vicinamibacterales bacterium]
MDAADRLFYTQGVRAVGIERVLAEADAAKASLYSHFRCKDELVAAYVERRVSAAREQIDSYVEDVPAAQRALRFFDWVVAWVESPGFRGCPLQHVVGELSDRGHPARKVAAAQRTWLLARFTEWARAARAADPAATAGALMVLFDGAIAASEQDGPQRARDARRAVERLLASRARAR